MSEWISVEERLPEDGQNVLAVRGGVVGYCPYNECYGFQNCYVGNHFPPPFGDVTHWMPLPEPPQ